MTDLAGAVLVHLSLAYAGLSLSVAAGIPLALLSLRSRAAGTVVSVLATTGQAIPVFALVAFMVPLAGIGYWPAVLAIFLATLLPVVRSTHAGLVSVDRSAVDAAEGIGLSWGETVLHVRLPLSVHATFAGIRFASVIANGVAVITVFIGSGGLGVIVLRGLARFHVPEILAGIVPAVGIALASDALLALLERRLAPAFPGGEDVTFRPPHLPPRPR